MQDESTSNTTADYAAAGKTANLIYILYLFGFIVGITSLIGLVMAYIYQDGAQPWVRSHYRFQIRTFWLSLLLIIVGAITSFLFVGYLILLFWGIWVVVRCVRGMKLASEGQAIPNPDTWRW
jgi:uncharacterized membrane protein